MTNALIETLNTVGDHWWSIVFHLTWQASILAAVLLLVVRLGRRWPSPLRYWLLMLGMIKFVVPFVPASPTGVFTWAGRTFAERNSLAAGVGAPAARVITSPVSIDVPPVDAGLPPDALSGVMHAANAPTFWPAGSGEIQSAGPSPGNTPPPHQVAATDVPTRAHLRWTAWCLLLHAIGVCFIAAWAARQWAALRRIRASASLAESGPFHARYVELCRRMNVATAPRLLLADQNVTPMALGVWKPAIVLPVRVMEGLSPRQVDAVLAHELAHHRRGDTVMNWVQLLVCTVSWFNPLAWLLGRQVRRVREECCDDMVVSRAVSDGDSYCQTLLSAARGLVGALPIGGALGFAAPMHPLAGRIRRVMDSSLRRPAQLSIGGGLLLFAAAATVLPGLASQSDADAPTLRVPADFGNIQAAIDAAPEGAIVLVADGVHTGGGNRHLDFRGKRLMVRSEHGAAGCVLDCEGEGRAFYFHSGETPESVVEGFTITGGAADVGGAVACIGSSPTIRDCVIEGNRAVAKRDTRDSGDDASSGNGGGIHLSASAAVIERSIIRANVADGRGGGIDCRDGSTPTITHCTIVDNTAAQPGGGIYFNASKATVTASTIRGNTASAGSGVFFSVGSNGVMRDCVISGNTSLGASLFSGGGIHCSSSGPTISGCVISGNVSAAGGGGLLCTDSWPRVEHCVITDNLAGESGGGGVYLGARSNAQLFNCLIVRNATRSWDNNTYPGSKGGGLVCVGGSSPVLTNCTISRNRSASGGDGALLGPGAPMPTFIGCILWGNDTSDLVVEEGRPLVRFSTIGGGWDGQGNSDADPIFVAGPLGSHYLSQRAAGNAADSPCLDRREPSDEDRVLVDRTTRSDGRGDRSAIDAGYHYPAVDPKARHDSLGGFVRDDRGKPLIGARVALMWDSADAAPGGDLRDAFALDAVVTATDGGWRIDGVPAALVEGGLAIDFAYPGYERVRASAANARLDAAAAPEATTEVRLRPNPATGMTVAGRVRNEQGEPVGGAVVYAAWPSNNGLRIDQRVSDATGADGLYRVVLPHADHGPGAHSVVIAAIGPEYAPVFQIVGASDAGVTLDLKLPEGWRATGRVVDESGAPVDEVRVSFSLLDDKADAAQKLGMQLLRFAVQTDSEGRFEWAHAPDAPLIISLWKLGFTKQRGTIVPDQPEASVFSLKRESPED